MVTATQSTSPFKLPGRVTIFFPTIFFILPTQPTLLSVYSRNLTEFHSNDASCCSKLFRAPLRRVFFCSLNALDTVSSIDYFLFERALVRISLIQNFIIVIISQYRVLLLRSMEQRGVVRYYHDAVTGMRSTFLNVRQVRESARRYFSVESFSIPIYHTKTASLRVPRNFLNNLSPQWLRSYAMPR